MQWKCTENVEILNMYVENIIYQEYHYGDGIKHHKIQPRTPQHNGKVERSHRNDNESFIVI